MCSRCVVNRLRPCAPCGSMSAPGERDREGGTELAGDGMGGRGREGKESLHGRSTRPWTLRFPNVNHHYDHGCSLLSALVFRLCHSLQGRIAETAALLKRMENPAVTTDVLLTILSSKVGGTRCPYYLHLSGWPRIVIMQQCDRYIFAERRTLS